MSNFLDNLPPGMSNMLFVMPCVWLGNKLDFNEGFRRHPWAALVKRAADVVVSVVMLLLLWPVMLATALTVHRVHDWRRRDQSAGG